jgi:hypothetical protein
MSAQPTANSTNIFNIITTGERPISGPHLDDHP